MTNSTESTIYSDSISLGKIGFIIMAVGNGTCMRSSLNKVLHPVGGLPMVNWVLRHCPPRQRGCCRSKQSRRYIRNPLYKAF